MLSENLVIDAISILTPTEKTVLYDLTHDEVSKEEILDFLEHYDIDRETALTTFLLNDLFKKYDIAYDHIAIGPRVKGIKAFFRFHNATKFMQLERNQVLYDTDLVLKIRYPDEIRPVTATEPMLNSEMVSDWLGEDYIKEFVNSVEKRTILQKEYRIPGEKYIKDMIYWGLYRSTRDSHFRDKTICYLYDIYRYCGEQISVAIPEGAHRKTAKE